MDCAPGRVGDGSIVTASISGDVCFSPTISAVEVGIGHSSADFGGYVGSGHVVGNCASPDLLSTRNHLPSGVVPLASGGRSPHATK